MVKLRPVDGATGDTRHDKHLSADTHQHLPNAHPPPPSRVIHPRLHTDVCSRPHTADRCLHSAAVRPRVQSADSKPQLLPKRIRVHLQSPDAHLRLQLANAQLRLQSPDAHLRLRPADSLSHHSDICQHHPSVYTRPQVQSCTARQQVPGDTHRHDTGTHTGVSRAATKGQAPPKAGTLAPTCVEGLGNKPCDGCVCGKLVSELEISGVRNPVLVGYSGVRSPVLVGSRGERNPDLVCSRGVGSPALVGSRVETSSILVGSRGVGSPVLVGSRSVGSPAQVGSHGVGSPALVGSRSEGNPGVVGSSSSSWLSSDALCLLFCCRREPREEEEATKEDSSDLAVYKVYGVRPSSCRVQATLLPSEDEDEEDVSDSGVDDVSNTQKVLTAKLEDLRTCHDLIIKHGAALQKSLGELEAIDNTHDLTAKTKTVNERATLFRISSNAMINACSDYVDVSSTAARKWQRLLQHERDQRVRLEDMVEQLARQHSHLEQEAKEQMNQAMPPGHSHSEDEEENEFEDAVEELAENFIVHVNTIQAHKRSNSNVSQASEGQGVGDTVSASSSEGDGQDNTVQVIMRKDNNTDSSYSLSEEMASLNGSQATTPTSEMKQANGRPKRQRRSRVPDKPNHPINLWSIMKNCIGKELSKIPMPVNFSEPLSFLQRLTEDFEYSDILDRAALIEDTCEQLSLVAAFTVSSYATTAERTAKPFNPLLGETYECDRTDDLGWKAVSEQVSHHPPIVAQFVEGINGWTSWQEFSMSSKFRGKYLQIIPLGIAHLNFDHSGNHYTWRKVSTTVHNMIVGKLWLDNHGEMEIINHKTGDKCCLKFIPYSYFSRETPKKVTGYVVDNEGTFKWFITGMWDEKIEACRVTSQSMRGGKPTYETGPPKVLWKRNTVNPEAERYYNFTELACQLNEPEENVAPTDSRNRPDQRLMEEGNWEEANLEKLRLEEKQRATRRKREADAELAANEGREYPAYSPTWFRKLTDEATGALIFRYTHEYWDCKERQDWSRCPDIF